MRLVPADNGRIRHAACPASVTASPYKGWPTEEVPTRRGGVRRVTAGRLIAPGPLQRPRGRW